MAKAKHVQRPRQGQQHAQPCRRITNRSVPLRQERHAAIVQWIPKRNLAAQDARAKIMNSWIREQAEVVVEKGMGAKENLGILQEQQDGNEENGFGGGEPIRPWRGRVAGCLEIAGEGWSSHAHFSQFIGERMAQSLM